MANAIVVSCAFLVLLKTVADAYIITAGAPVNLAFGKKTIQSSTRTDEAWAVSSSAVDGNKNPDYFKGKTCTHTGPTDGTPWFVVDLGAPTFVESVVVTNRGDCCPERLNNMVVGLTNIAPTDTAPTANTYWTCGVGPAAAGASITVNCARGWPARYVVILIPQAPLTICEIEVYGQEMASLAFHKPTIQSSTRVEEASAKSSSAVDGNRDSNYFHGSCSHTGPGDKKPWWAVDLGAAFDVLAVQVTNRADCCPERLNNLLIGVTNNDPATHAPAVNTLGVCGIGPASVAAGQTFLVACTPGMSAARYVAVLSPQEALTICELEVFGRALTNLAQGKQARQSTNFEPTTVAARAVDGNANPQWAGASCSHTAKDDTHPWWAVDLGQVTNVQRVEVTNRADCCPERLNNFVVGLTNTAPVAPVVQASIVVCGKGPAVAPAGVTIPVVCAANSPPARFVIVQTPQEYLTLCEVAVFGTPALVNMAYGKTAWESSKYPFASEFAEASWAVDGNRNSQWLGKSCSHTADGDLQPWWAVDLGVLTRVNRVEITNRADCCPERLNNVVVGLTNNSPATTKPTLGNVDVCGRVPVGAAAGARVPVYCPHAIKAARYVALLSPNQHLTLCEVEVVGYPAQ